jgi:hypothetical protein
MGIYSSAFRTATQLTAQSRAAADVVAAGFQLSDWFPSQENFSLSYDFDPSSVSLTDAATYRTFETEAPFGSTPGDQARSGKLPPISRKLRVKEFDQLTLFGQTDAIGAKFDDYARRLGAQIAARVALAQGQAVETGTIVLQENGLNFTIDFGRKAGHTVTAGTVWSTITANALGDLTTWVAAYVATNGTAPAVAMMSTAILSALQKNQSIITAATGLSTANQPAIISQDQVRAVFASYGFGRIVVNDDQVNVANVATRLISSDKLIFLPESGGSLGVGGGLGSTEWGVPAEAINADYGIADAEKPGLFAAAFHDNDPEGHNVLASAIVLPVENNANRTFAADVL